MALNLSELAASNSTRYEILWREEYNRTVAVEDERLSPLLMQIDQPNFRGKTVDMNWLGAAPQMREWVDEKRAIGLADFNLSVVIKRYEASVEIDLDDFMDARENLYDPRIREMAQNGSRLRYNLVSDLIAAGESGTCYDGQNFFDTDHSEGSSGTQSNELTGTGTSAAQLKADYYTAIAALTGFKDDKGVPLQPSRFRPLIWIPNSATMIERFEELAQAPLISNTTNVIAGKFDLVIDPRQTDSNDWYMFRTDGAMKPFILVNREEVHYEDNFGSGNDDVFKRRIGMASAVGRMAATYGMWQRAVKIKNA